MGLFAAARLVFVCLLPGTLFLSALTSLAQDTLPIPSAESQQKALALVKEVYGQEWEAAKTPEQKTALAQKLLYKSTEATDDATRFALIRVARDVAVQGGDVYVAFRAIDVTSYRFQIDTFAAKVQTLSEVAKSASTPAQQKAIATEAQKLIEQAVKEDDFETVKRLYETAAAVARSANEWDMARQIVARNREIEEVVSAYAAIDDALATLKSNPVDPEANLAVGKYHCFIKGNWSRGLPMLALGSDDKLKDLAVKELKGVVGANDEVALGDGWWGMAATSEGMAQKELGERAAIWYRKALPGLIGLVKDRVAGRLEEVKLVHLKPSGMSEGKPINRPSPPIQERPKGGIVARVYACCDDRFVMCVNGTRILSGGQRQVDTVDHEFFKGDVITVRTENFMGPSGFSCVIRFQTGAAITTASGWATYKPASQEEWFKPENVQGIDRVTRGKSGWPSDIVRSATKVSAPEIWGHGNPCYLVFVVR